MEDEEDESGDILEKERNRFDGERAGRHEDSMHSMRASLKIEM